VLVNDISPAVALTLSSDTLLMVALIAQNLLKGEESCAAVVDVLHASH